MRKSVIRWITLGGVAAAVGALNTSPASAAADYYLMVQPLPAIHSVSLVVGDFAPIEGKCSSVTRNNGDDWSGTSLRVSLGTSYTIYGFASKNCTSDWSYDTMDGFTPKADKVSNGAYFWSWRDPQS